MVTDRVFGFSWSQLFNDAADVCSKDIWEVGLDEETKVPTIGIMRKNWCQCQIESVEASYENKLIEAVTFIKTSPGPGSGIARVPNVTGLPSSVTKRAFCIL